MTSFASRPFKWAILGTGPVARKFALGLKLLKGAAELQAVASRNPENARDFARALGGPAFETYEDAVGQEVDAVYIATPPALHEAHAELAFAAGRPVLIEKPLAADAASARRIAAKAAEHGLFAMEAMWTRFLPLMETARRDIEAGALGELRAFDAAFLRATKPNGANSLFDPVRGGGALLNRGVYPLSLARFLMGPVTEVQCLARLAETGVDEDCSLMVRHASGAISTLRSSLRTSGEPPMVVYGTTGTLRFEGPVWRPLGAKIMSVTADHGMSAPARFETLRETPLAQQLSRKLQSLKALRNRARSLPAPLLGSGYQYEAAEVMECVGRGDLTSKIMPLSESIEILDVIEDARRTWQGGS